MMPRDETPPLSRLRLRNTSTHPGSGLSSLAVRNDALQAIQGREVA